MNIIQSRPLPRLGQISLSSKCFSAASDGKTLGGCYRRACREVIVMSGEEGKGGVGMIGVFGIGGTSLGAFSRDFSDGFVFVSMTHHNHT